MEATPAAPTEYADLQAKVKALDTWLGTQPMDGPECVQVVLLWVALVLRDQAQMPELGQACFETAKVATATYRARAAEALRGSAGAVKH